MLTAIKKRRRTNATRTGAVLVEFAMVLPIVVVLFSGLIEISRVLLLQHTADTAAYEGARAAMVPGATADEAKLEATRLLEANGLHSTKVTVTPETLEEASPLITVLVEIPVGPNSWIAPIRFFNMNISSEVTLFCERPPIVRLTGVPALKAKKTKGKAGAGL